ncbi:hypothetical protein COV11_03855 [Candidatus Woesearchaeota archaeon CG10_big_fil_rev_8_21_14_0_10_30_7]|nr:MAG: hypothetical protein COV11_03855 [Candidatus Woesearchaeota archaeon CG10_big_fil_rev_8_21_14_0_10_30_7]
MIDENIPLNRRKACLLWSDHALYDKNLNKEDSYNAEYTVKHGKIDLDKSNKDRICYKNYFKKEKKTYFVVVIFKKDFIKIITIIKKNGKY